MSDFHLLEKLVQIQAPSGNEAPLKDFIVDYVTTNQSRWKSKPQVFHGKGFQDAIVMVFGKPTTAIFAHMDSIGFTVGYDNNLIKIGGPQLIDGTELVGEDSIGKIETELVMVEEDDDITYRCSSDRMIDRGTSLTFKPNFREDEEYIQSPYIDNRLGVWVALEVAKTLENGAIVFSTYEEHGGGSVGYLGRFLYDQFDIQQALISDITWVTEGIKHGKGVAISMRDQGIPRRSYLDKIVQIASDHSVHFQLEVESAGGSDGTMLQKSDLPFDWCFIGAPEDHVHSPDEKVHKSDIEDMIKIYQILMKNL